EATVRRVPRFGVFMGAGVVLGIIAAGILTLIGSGEPSEATGVAYPAGQVFGFLLLWTVPIGLALGGVVALILERVVRRGQRTVHVEHERIAVTEEDEAEGDDEADAADGGAPRA